MMNTTQKARLRRNSSEYVDHSPINRNSHPSFNILDPEKKKFIRKSNRKGTAFSRLSGLHEIDDKNQNNFKNQHKKYDVRRKSIRFESTVFEKFKSVTNKYKSFTFLASSNSIIKGKITQFLT